MRYLRTFIGVTFAAGLAVWPALAMAQSAYINPSLITAAAPTVNWSYVITGLLRLTLGVFSLLFLTWAVWGWFLCGIHGGNEEKIDTATETVKSGVIGGVIFLILAAAAKPAVGLAIGLVSRYLTAV